MAKTESYYADDECMKCLSDPYLLELHKGKKTSIVTAALKDYYRRHRPPVEDSIKEKPIPTVRIRI